MRAGSAYDGRVDWYYLKQGRQFGPVPQRSILAWLDSGFLEAHDLVWTEGMKEWAPTAEVPALGGEPGPPGTRGREGVSPYAPVSAPTPHTAAYASFSARALAYLIDVFLVSVILSIAWILKDPEAFNDPDAVLRNRSFMISTYLTVWLYFAAFESSGWQATLGKRMLGLRVASADGTPITFPRAFLRQVAKVLSALPLQAGFLLAIFTPRRQALHDLIARTVVLRR